MKTIVDKSFLLVTVLLVIFSSKSIAQFEQKFTLQAAGGYVQALQPDFFSDVFNNGFSFDGGAQYNFSRSTSIVVLAKYSTFFAREGLIGGDVEFNLIGISLCPKYKLFTEKRLNPYIYGGASINYYTFSFGDFKFEWSTEFGFTGGIGFDYRINDNLGLFLQGGLSGVDSSNEMIIALYSQVGVTISLFKSKSL
jgi:hypothetical protein